MTPTFQFVIEESPMIQPLPASMIAARHRARQRTALIASADHSFRQWLSHVLSGLRWKVREAASGAQAWTEAETIQPDAVIVDSWLPDLDLGEFVKDFRSQFPQVDVIAANGDASLESPRGPYRQELLYALRHSRENDTVLWNASVDLPPDTADGDCPVGALHEKTAAACGLKPVPTRSEGSTPGESKSCERLPELVGNAPCMLEVSRRVRLVAQRVTPVLIEGPTGSGKELVAAALHRLSTRNRKPFFALNCAAIPEALLEAELFGHTRGAFTGAVQGRVGRIEAADGGTLFLDEIGEMPLALQAKLLRFVECGELQRVGDNETVKVDVRILAATHRQLASQASTGAFRSDLYYRLAVFLIRTPALSSHLPDLPVLVEHFLEKLGRDMPMKRADATAMEKLAGHCWPGNVRELEHVLERAVILAGEAPVLTANEIDFGIDVN
jgi:DNA-binding NtrC family response regulator